MKTTLLELGGFALIAYGAWLAWAPLGFIVGGTLLALVAYLVDRGVAS
jgi:hypothetical protein